MQKKIPNENVYLKRGSLMGTSDCYMEKVYERLEGMEESNQD